MKGRIVSDQLATDWDHRIIDGLSYAMSQTEHTLGVGDTAWLRGQIENGSSDDKLKVATEIAVAFIRFSQDKKAQLAAAQSRIAGHIEHIKSLELEVEQLKAEKFRRFGNQDCWMYQGDGEDHLETLVCPVVIAPHKLIEIESQNQQLRELAREWCEAFETSNVKAVPDLIHRTERIG